MKKVKLLAIGAIIAISSIVYTPAKADTPTQTQQSNGLLGGLGDFLNGLLGGGNNSGSGSGSGTGTSGSGSTNLPINGNIWFLVIAGGAVGCKVIMGNGKPVAKTQKI